MDVRDRLKSEVHREEQAGRSGRAVYQPQPLRALSMRIFDAIAKRFGYQKTQPIKRATKQPQPPDFWLIG